MFSAFLNYRSLTGESIDFREHIISGKGIHNDGGLVKLIILDDGRLGYYYYLPNSTTLYAHGVIERK